LDGLVAAGRSRRARAFFEQVGACYCRFAWLANKYGHAELNLPKGREGNVTIRS
jgi:hypothetical protein